MNRNTNSHFSEIPGVDIRRSILDRSHTHKTSGNVGDIIPIYVDPDIMPGDTVTMDTSKVIRLQTMLSPVMDNLYADVYWFFVPHRLTWDHFINLMGENTSSAWAPEVQYTVPVLKVPGPDATNTNNYVGSILDYMGFPVEMPYPDDVQYQEVSALPVRAYAKICQDWFISENLSDPLNLYTGDAAVTAATDSGTYINDVPAGGHPFKAAKFADYFSSALPAPQKGDAIGVTLDLPSYLPVQQLDMSAYGADNFNRPPLIVTPRYESTTTSNSFNWAFKGTTSGSDYLKLYGDEYTTFDAAYEAGVSNSQNFRLENLFAVTNDARLNFSINDVRYAFQLQKLLERDARGGSRYIEVIKAHFGVQSPDSRLQRSEYLGGNRFSITVDQVLNNAQTENDFLGDLGAYSVTSDVHSDFTHSFTEHGTLMGLLVLRYNHTYSQGLQKFWLRKDRFSFYWPVFANIGEQPILKKEIYMSGELTDEDPWGYQEAWADYRYQPDRVSGEMRPYVSNGLFSWSYADDYDSQPSLSDSWIREDKAGVDRTLAVTSDVSNQFWADFYFKTKYTRPMPVFSIPGLIDHN